MSEADTPTNDLPIEPAAEVTPPLPDLPSTEEMTEAVGAAPQFAPPATEPPAAPSYAAEAPTEQVPSYTAEAPTQQFPAASTFPTQESPATPSYAEAPTAAMPSVAPAPSSVVLSANAPAAPKKKGVLAWALAGIAAIAAIVFAILWVGKSGDADDLTTERNALVAEKGTLEGELATANSDLESTKGELESATSDLDAATAKAEDLQSEIDGLSTQVDDLTAELEAAQNQPATGTKAADYAPRLSLGLGQALGANADPALSDDEALCLGSNLIDIAGIDLVFGDYFEEIELTEDEANRFGRSFILAAASCGIEFTRLNL